MFYKEFHTIHVGHVRLSLVKHKVLLRFAFQIFKFFIPQTALALEGFLLVFYRIGFNFQDFANE